MEIDHIDSILDVDEHGNPRFTCSVKPDYRDQWVSSDSPREPLRASNHTEYYNTLREVLSEEQINALAEDCLRLLGRKIF